MADLKQFAEQLVGLTVKEVNELATILKEEYGIEPAAAAVVAGPAAGGAPQGQAAARATRVARHAQRRLRPRAGCGGSVQACAAGQRWFCAVPPGGTSARLVLAAALARLRQ